MDDAMRLPRAERERALGVLLGPGYGPVSYNSETGLIARPTLPTREDRKAAVAVLRSSQAHVCLFNNRKRVAIFWATPEIARRYIQIRNSLINFSVRAGELIGQEAVEVSFNWNYSHASPLSSGGQEELIPHFSEKMHAFWVTADSLISFTGSSSIREAFGIENSERLDLQWQPVRMLNRQLDSIYAQIISFGVFQNPEPWVAPRPPPYLANERMRTAEEQLSCAQRWIDYDRLITQLRNAITPNDWKGSGRLDTILNADGLAFTRAGYPTYRTPTLTWKQIRSVLPKRKKKAQITSDHNPDAKRKLVIVQRKEE
jgi:hypothetical protein